MRFITLLIVCMLSAYTINAEEYGYASYYNNKFDGKKTASGELYQKELMTASHKSLPFGTIIRVTRLDNNKSVKVKINDRGPFTAGRVTDLSYAAASSLGILTLGEAKVKIDVLESPGEKPLTTEPDKLITPKNNDNDFTVKGVSLTNNDETSKDTAPKAVKPKNIKKAAVVEPKKEIKKTNLVTPKDYNNYGLYKVQVARPDKEGYAIQVANITQYENVLKQIADLQGSYYKNILVSVEKGKDDKPQYKILLGPFPDMPTAASYQKSLKKKKMSGFIVNLADLK